MNSKFKTLVHNTKGTHEVDVTTNTPLSQEAFDELYKSLCLLTDLGVTDVGIAPE